MSYADEQVIKIIAGIVAGKPYDSDRPMLDWVGDVIEEARTIYAYTLRSYDSESASDMEELRRMVYGL
jgi:hypothetical protein